MVSVIASEAKQSPPNQEKPIAKASTHPPCPPPAAQPGQPVPAGELPTRANPAGRGKPYPTTQPYPCAHRDANSHPDAHANRHRSAHPNAYAYPHPNAHTTARCEPDRL